MQRIIIFALGVALLVSTAWVVRGAAAGSTAESARLAKATIEAHSGQRKAQYQSELEHNILHQHPATATTGATGHLASQLAAARLATARYATDLRAAKAAGYQIITRMIPDMGWHFLNPAIQGFHVTRPQILVYERHGSRWQLGALEWVFPAKPATPPLPGATYWSFGAACHYQDGTFVFASSQDACAKRSPQTGAAFNFWHPGPGHPACGCGTPTPPGSTTAPTPTSSPSTAASPPPAGRRMADDIDQRGIDLLNPVWNILDLTPQGRGDWYAELSLLPLLEPCALADLAIIELARGPDRRAPPRLLGLRRRWWSRASSLRARPGADAAARG